MKFLTPLLITTNPITAFFGYQEHIKSNESLARLARTQNLLYALESDRVRMQENLSEAKTVSGTFPPKASS